jgi:hypothetical protein
MTHSPFCNEETISKRGTTPLKMYTDVHLLVSSILLPSSVGEKDMIMKLADFGHGPVDIQLPYVFFTNNLAAQCRQS